MIIISRPPAWKHGLLETTTRDRIHDHHFMRMYNLPILHQDAPSIRKYHLSAGMEPYIINREAGRP